MFAMLSIALASYVGMQPCFWLFNFPANAAVASWGPATLPAGWFAYRARWEWSHATRAVFAFIAFVCLLHAALVEKQFNTPDSHQRGYWHIQPLQ